MKGKTFSSSFVRDCSMTYGSPGLPVAGGLQVVFSPRGFLVSGFTFGLISTLSSPSSTPGTVKDFLPTGRFSSTTVWVLETVVFWVSGQYTLSMRTYAPFRNVVRSNQRHDSDDEVKFKKL